ncbi:MULTISPECIES: hypothetical protein [unclassified Sphingobium]|uniref:hypothetical protein n=1 Tax=unclassified Sphingobium TaxID=2611147 RepID=UPI0005CBA4FB|nr:MULTISPECIES: hypothetical protein [unclassified Sphingobium]AJR22505.1 hypothetical protein TZ53_00585 [Sphingobium sp. YBL2]UXC89493.1 hypothetical protein EGM87_10415 [Sphingobium sp. RSMS]
MRRKTLSLHGSYVECYLYFDFAWLISKDGLIRAFDIEEFCNKRLNGSGNAAGKLFADNRRIVLGRPDQEIDRLLEVDSTIDVSEDDVERFSYTFDRKIDFKSVLDIRFYYGRAYLSTEKSIHQFTALDRDNLEFGGIGRTARVSLNQRRVSDLACRQFRCRYGAVSAACGKNGGLIAFGTSTDESGWEIAFQEFASQSYGIELNTDAISNLRTPTQVEFYRAKSGRAALAVENRFEAEESKQDNVELMTVSGLDYTDQSALFKELIEHAGSSAKRVFLFKSTIWVEFQNGTIKRLAATDRDQIVEIPRELGSFTAPGRVLSTDNTKMGVVVESDDSVFLRRPKLWVTLVNDQVHSVRGYMNSKRYQNIVTAVRRECVELIALVP